MTFTPVMAERIYELLAQFKLPFASEQVVKRFEQVGCEGALPTLLEVLEAEAGGRSMRRSERLLRASRLPLGKTMATLDLDRLPKPVVTQLHELATGAFLERTTNVLAFGLPGTGKTHAACAIGHELVNRGHAVLFCPTFQLVQDLLAAKRDLALPRALRKLDAYDLLILDDIGYVQQNAEEIEVLFTLMAERYERRSLLITSNLVFGEWDKIFKNPMTTAAAIDRVVHHSAILEFDVESYRAQDARKRGPAEPSEGSRRASRARG